MHQVGAFFTYAPNCVLGGLETFLFGTIAVAGIKVMVEEHLIDRRTRFIITVAGYDLSSSLDSRSHYQFQARCTQHKMSTCIALIWTCTAGRLACCAFCSMALIIPWQDD